MCVSEALQHTQAQSQHTASPPQANTEQATPSVLPPARHTTAYHQYRKLYLAHLSIEVVVVFVGEPDLGVVGVSEGVGLDPVVAPRVPAAARHHPGH